MRTGEVRKFVSRVERITFSGQYARERGQQVLYVTERAVFRLGADGIELIEVAPGLDIERDVLAHMDFRPSITGPVEMPSASFL
jgi:propionate CoA-transferase